MNDNINKDAPQANSRISVGVIKSQRAKIAIYILLSLLLPPSGLLLGLKKLSDGIKHTGSVRRGLFGWSLVFIVLAVLGSLGYLAIYRNINREEPEFYSTDFSLESLTVCLDGKQTILITDTSPYTHVVPGSETKPVISLSTANNILQNKGGNFRTYEGGKLVNHHIDKGLCR